MTPSSFLNTFDRFPLYDRGLVGGFVSVYIFLFFQRVILNLYSNSLKRFQTLLMYQVLAYLVPLMIFEEWKN